VDEVCQFNGDHLRAGGEGGDGRGVVPFHLQYFDQSCIGVGKWSSVSEASFSALNPGRWWKMNPSPFDEPLLFSDSMEALGLAKPPRGRSPRTAVSACFAFARLAFLMRGR